MFALVATASVSAGETTVPVPLTKSASVTKSGYVAYPRAALAEHRQGTVVAHVVINRGGGVVEWRFDDGADASFERAAEEALRSTRFTAPMAAAEWRSSANADGCVPFYQSVKLEYRFTMDGEAPRTDVAQEFAIQGFAASEDIDSSKRWAEAHEVQRQSKLPGFVDIKPKHRSEPQFAKSTQKRLWEVPMMSPQVVVVTMVVGKDGSVEDAFATDQRGDPFHMIRNALKAVRTWEFEPARLDGEPVARLACQQFNLQTEW